MARRTAPSLSLLSIAVIFASTVVAQNNPTVLNLSDPKLPQCASSCAALTGANGACVPPAVAVTNQATYQACFCNAQELIPFKTNPNAIYCSSCAATDLPAIQSYYNSLCASDPAQTTSKSTVTTTTTKKTSSSTKKAGSTAASTSKDGQSAAAVETQNANNNNDDDKSWFSNHWQWVLLVIILTIAFAFFLTLGFWLKRRHHRKEELRLSGAGGLDSGSPYASGSLPYVGGAGNHPQMTVVPGAGDEAAMARYDGSGVGSIGSRPQSMVRTSNVGTVTSIGPYGEAGAGYGSSSRDAVVPPPLAAMREDSNDSRESQRKRLRTTLRPTAEDDIEAIGSGNERGMSRNRSRRSSGGGGDGGRADRLKSKIKKTVGK